MDCRRFRDLLFAHIDGELPGTDAAAARAHEADCTACAQQAVAERAFEDGVQRSLLSGTPAPDVSAIVAAAAQQPAAPAGRFVRLWRVGQAAAAAAALFVGFAWFTCLPPFECSYLQAVESATGAPSAAGEPHPVDAPDELLGHARIGPSDTVTVDYGTPAAALRARYDVNGETAVVVWARNVGEAPSFRRRVEIDGVVWWVAEENGNTIVAYMCPVSNTLCSIVGPLPADELRRLATALRSEGAR